MHHSTTQLSPALVVAQAQIVPKPCHGASCHGGHPAVIENGCGIVSFFGLLYHAGLPQQDVGGSFRGEGTYKSPEKNFAYRRRTATNQCSAQTEFFVCTSVWSWCFGGGWWCGVLLSANSNTLTLDSDCCVVPGQIENQVWAVNILDLDLVVPCRIIYVLLVSSIHMSHKLEAVNGITLYCLSMHLSWCDLFTDILTTWASYSPSLISAHWDTWLWGGDCACTNMYRPIMSETRWLVCKKMSVCSWCAVFPFLAPMKQLSFLSRFRSRTFSLHQRRGNCTFRFGVSSCQDQDMYVTSYTWIVTTTKKHNFTNCTQGGM